MPEWDAAIIGAGAAGLAAGIFAAQGAPGARIALFDGARRLGAKILVAGGGRCNVTHDHVDPRDYNATSRNFVKNVLNSFTVADAAAWFASLGVELKREETGKLFPVTDEARTVLDALLGRLNELGTAVHTEHRVRGVGRVEGGFLIQTERGGQQARRVILCTGGRSLPKTGSDGGGYELARSLGHTVTPTHPALVSMVLQQHFFHAELTGISHPARLTTKVDQKPIDRRDGSLLWTHFGLSGPLVLDASRHWLAAKLAGQTPQWTLSLLPEVVFETLEAILIRLADAQPRLALRQVFDAVPELAPLPQKVALALLSWLKLDGGVPLAQLRREERRKLVHALTALPLPVEQDRGWNYAEVTAGGVPLSEVNWRTMESRLVPGLHLTGEILDLDGRIGGFNFQWAWATGSLAGRAAAQSVGAADSGGKIAEIGSGGAPSTGTGTS